MNVLIIGLGSIAAKHIQVLREIVPTVSLTALRSSNSEPQAGIRDIFSWEEVDFKPDFVLISNPTKFHREAILNAIPLDCPLFIEKPVLASVNDAEDIGPLLQRKNIITYIGCNLRFHPVILFLREFLNKNSLKINEVNVYCGSNLREWRPTQDYRLSYSADAARGGGVHLDLIHEIDYCYWLFGKPVDVVAVQRKVSSLQINSADFATYHLIYKDFTVNIVLNYYRPEVKRTVEIVAEEGIIHADLIKPLITINQEEVFHLDDYSVLQTYREQMKYFLDILYQGEASMNDFSGALDVLKIALAHEITEQSRFYIG